jgi:hypothetical protein
LRKGAHREQGGREGAGGEEIHSIRFDIDEDLDFLKGYSIENTFRTMASGCKGLEKYQKLMISDEKLESLLT